MAAKAGARQSILFKRRTTCSGSRWSSRGCAKRACGSSAQFTQRAAPLLVRAARVRQRAVKRGVILLNNTIFTENIKFLTCFITVQQSRCRIQSEVSQNALTRSVKLMHHINFLFDQSCC